MPELRLGFGVWRLKVGVDRGTLRIRATVRSYVGVVSYERGAPVRSPLTGYELRAMACRNSGDAA